MFARTPATVVNKSAAGEAATVTITALPSGGRIIDSLQFGYDNDPQPGATLTITCEGSIYLQVPVVKGGPGCFEFPTGLTFPVNSAVTVTLSAGGGTIYAYINVNYR